MSKPATDPTAEKDLATVLHYWIDQTIDDSRPLDVLLAMARLAFPERTWGLDASAGEVEDDELYYSTQIVDEEGNRLSKVSEGHVGKR